MDFKEASPIYNIGNRRLLHVPVDFHRSLYAGINWQNRLIAIKGARGTGKTTLMLQRIKEAFGDCSRALYVSLDNLWFAAHSLMELVDFHVSHGGTHLFMDEVHYMKDWQTAIKNLYDDYPKLSIVYTGSSMLRISVFQGDLSRRQVIYNLHGLSFREFLEFEGISNLPKACPLPDLLANHIPLAMNVASQIPVRGFFDRYLQSGYYPFYKEPGDGYEARLGQMVNQVLESDYPAIESVTPATIRKARRMLMLLAARPPQTPNISELARELELDRATCLQMLYSLEKADLLNLLEAQGASLKNLSRPQKIYCENPNLMHGLVPDTDIGTLRECFFLNQMKSACNVMYPQAGDFLADGKYHFEVGGPGKTFRQIKDFQDSYLAVDSLDAGTGNRIPLWCFGFLY